MPSFTMIVPACLALYGMVEDDHPNDRVFAKGRWLIASWAVSRRQGTKQMVIAGVAWTCIVLGLLIFVAGTYGSIQGIVDSYASGGVGTAFSCADNS